VKPTIQLPGGLFEAPQERPMPGTPAKTGQGGPEATRGLKSAPPERGPFADSKVTPEKKEALVAGMIWQHQGRANPIAISLLSKATGWSAREIKSIVEQLVVTHRMKIGASRNQETGGYFVVVDAEDVEVAARPYRNQVFAMMRRLRVLLSEHKMREFHGQLTISKGDQ